MNAKRRSQRPKYRITSVGIKPPRASLISGSVASVLPGQRGAMRLPCIHVHLSRVNAKQRRELTRLCERENVVATRTAEASYRDDRQDAPEVWECIGHAGNLASICHWIDGTSYVRLVIPMAGGAPFIAAGSGGTESAGASKAIRRVTMPKAERESRYARETAEYRQSVRNADRDTAIAAAMRADTIARADNGFIAAMSPDELAESYHHAEMEARRRLAEREGK